MGMKITREMIELGLVYVEVYPMVGDRLTHDRNEEPEYYDVMLRPDDWGETNGTAYREWEDLTFEQVNEVIEKIEAKYPNIAISWVNE